MKPLPLLLASALAVGTLTACSGGDPQAPSPSSSAPSFPASRSLAAAWDALGAPGTKTPTPWRAESLRLEGDMDLGAFKGKGETVTMTFSRERQRLVFTGLPNLKMLRVKTLEGLPGAEGGQATYRLEVEEPDAMTAMASLSERVNGLERVFTTKVPQEAVILTLSSDGQGLTLKAPDGTVATFDRTP